MWAMILMGWPAILLSLCVSVYGVASRRPAYLVAGAALCLGFAWYLTLWPSPTFKLLGFCIPLAHLWGAAAVRQGRPWLGWLLLAPHGATAAYLAVLVLSQ